MSKEELIEQMVTDVMEDFDFDPKPGVDIEYGSSWGLFQKWSGETVNPEELQRP